MGKKHGFGAKIRYSFDNLMSKGGLSVFLALMCLFIGAIVLMSAVRFVVNLITPQENMTNLLGQWWLTFLQITDAGAVAEDTESNVLHRVAGIISLFLGLVLFSSLVAFITSQFEETLARMRKGKSNVIEKNHTLILGFSDRVLEIIRELIIANESEKRPAVVVLSRQEKDEMDDFFRDRIDNMKNTRIICRSGSPSSLRYLRRAGIETAKSVIILNEAAGDAPRNEKELTDAIVLKTIMAVRSCTGEEKLPPIVAELHMSTMQQLALHISDRISIIKEQSILAKLIVQTSRISGLAQIYDHLVGFEGNEFYFYRHPGGWGGKTYGSIMFHFPRCCLLAVRNDKGEILINPDKDTILKESDEAILLAEDDSTIRYSRQMVHVNPPLSKPISRLEKKVERQLIIGWNRKAGIVVDEYSQYLIKGSGIDVVINEPTAVIKNEFKKIKDKYPAIQIRLIKADIRNLDVISKLKPDQYDNVIILTGDGSNAEIKDSDTIAKLLEFRHYFKNLGREDTELKTQLITEVADSENIEVIQDAGVKDFLISNQFVSKIYAQVSEEPDVLKIYDNLFNEEGSEVYLKPVTHFLTPVPDQISFGDLCIAALERNETCFGVRLIADETNPDKHYGIHINPSKRTLFYLKDNDLLITLAEDET